MITKITPQPSDETPQMPDESREGINLAKIIQFFKLFHPKYTKTFLRLEHFPDLDVDKIRELTGVEIEGIILDVDCCIAPNHGEILPENLEHLRKLIAKGIKFVIYSNMKWSERYGNLQNDLPVLTNLPPKPDPKGFEIAVQRLGLPKENVVMVGDNYLTDGGAIGAGIRFIHVNPIRREHEGFVEKIQNALRAVGIFLSRFYEENKKK